MGGFTSAIRHALRRLSQTPFLTLAALTILALGISSAVITVDIADRLLLRPSARIADPEQVARVYIGSRNRDSYIDRVDYATFEALASLSEVDAAAVYFTEPLSLGRGARARRVEVVAHSADYFRVLGVQPFIGSFTGAGDAAVISHALWRHEYDGSYEVLGKRLRLGEQSYSVVAVAPPGFAGLDFKPADVWLPLPPRANAVFGPQWQTTALFLESVARVKAGLSRTVVNDRATAAYRATHTGDWQKSDAVVLGDLRPARAPGAHPETRVEVLVAGMSIFVLLLTCGNVANLLLVRGLQRDREFMIKTALGASRTRLFNEVLLEAASLAVAAGCAALLVVVLDASVVRQLFLPPVAALAPAVDTRVVAVTVSFSAVAALALGLAPAILLTARPGRMLGRRATAPPTRILDVFSGLQIALSLPLLIAAALFVLSLWNARHQDFGMRTDRVIVITINSSEVGRASDNDAMYRRMQARVASLPAVQATALTQQLPMQSFSSAGLDVPGKDLWKGAFDGEHAPGINAVDPAFFGVMGMRLDEGRLFTEAENRVGAAAVAVITSSMARYIWPGESAVGKCFYRGDRSGPCTEVIGVLADARLFPSIRPTQRWAMAYYVPRAQQSGGRAGALLVRTAEDPARVMEQVRRAAQDASGDVPYVEAHAFDDVFTSMLRPWRLGSVVFVALGVLSLVVAAAGLAAITAYAITRRTREIGIRSALGAEPRQILGLLMTRSCGVILSGIAAGLAIAWATRQILNAQLFGIAAADTRVITAAILVLAMAGVVASWLPARRAARIDPAIALRAE